MQFLINIDQGRRNLHIRLNRKAEAVRLPVVVVGVLPQNHHLYPGKGCKLKRIEDVIRLREDSSRLVLMFDLLIKFPVIWLFKLHAQWLQPVIIDRTHIAVISFRIVLYYLPDPLRYNLMGSPRSARKRFNSMISSSL